MKYLLLAIIMIIEVHHGISLEVDGGDTLLLGDSLTGNQTITSKNSTFTLGFFSPGGTHNWYIGIWYAPISQKAIVWVANREKPVRSMPGVLKFSRDGHLNLFDGNGLSVWSTDASPKGSRAVIMDSGNFIMLDAHNQTQIVWESFAHPGNTWLPGMKMWKGMKLTSWKSSVDPAVGLFSLEMDKSPGKTKMMMVYNKSVVYSSGGEWTGNQFAKIPEMSGQKRLQMTCIRVAASSIYINFSINPIDHTLTGRFLLDENGELQLYFWMDDGTWSLRWSTYRGQCSDYNICGAYGLCNPNDVCSCLQGFTPKHDSSGCSWWSNGCVRRIPLQCSITEGTTDGFLEAKNQYLPEMEAVIYNNEPTQHGCRTACLNNCSCTAFALAISDPPVCRLWFGDLLRMRVSPEGQSIFVKLAASELPHLTSHQSSKTSRLFLSFPPTFSAVLVLFLALFVLWKNRRLWKESVEEDVPITLKMFSYKELRIATENFKHKLERGGFGSVFKGILADNTLVAVKRLEGSMQGEKQFRAEISTIGRVQHVNLVSLRGFCLERSCRLLVYAYMPNSSLNSFLFSKSEEAKKVLDWKTRFEIALGTAGGLVYLHEECRDRIIHCDIKPENILLDGDFHPKIADFGLAKLVNRNFSRVLTTTRGTPGYLAPEWISGLPITPKADVYSFGMTLFEILSGRRNLDLGVEESRLYFPTWASSQIQRGNIIDVVDSRIASEADIEEVKRCAVVAGLCIQDDENERPSMSEVVKILEGTMEAPVPQIPRSLQVLLSQGDDDDSDTFARTPPISTGAKSAKQ